MKSPHLLPFLQMPQSSAEGERESALTVTGAVLSALLALFRLFLDVRQGLYYYYLCLIENSHVDQ